MITCGLKTLMRTAAPVPRAVPTLLQRGQGARVAGVGPPHDLRQARLEVAGRVAHRVVGVGGLAQQRAQADGGLPAAAPAAAAHDLRVAERGVPDLAGEAPRPRAAAGRPRSRRRRRRPRRSGRRGPAVRASDPIAHSAIAERFASFSTRTGQPRSIRARRPSSTGTSCQPMLGAYVATPSRLRIRPGTATVTPTGAAPRAAAAAAASADQPGHRVQRPVGAERRDVEGDPVLEQHLAAQVEDEGRGVVDVELDADAADGGAVEVHDQPGAADRAGPVDVAGADQPPVGELGDEAGDGGLVQPRLLRDAGPGAGAGVTQVAEHEPEVAAPYRGLVGRRVPPARRPGRRPDSPVVHLPRPLIRRYRQHDYVRPAVPTNYVAGATRSSPPPLRSAVMTHLPVRTACRAMTLVAGVDTSTQACKVVVRDADTGELVRSGRAAHPDGTEVAPRAWARRVHRGRRGRRRARRRGGAGRRAASSTGWSASTRTAPSSGTRCSGTTSGPRARRPT